MNTVKLSAALGISGAALAAFFLHYAKQRQKGQSSSGDVCDEDGVCCAPNRSGKQPAKRDCTVWQIDESDMAAHTFNPIRAIVDTLDEKKCNPEKPIIRLSIGDPAVFGNMNPAAEVLEQMKLVLFSNKANGYDPSVGSEAARAAIAERSNAEIRALNVNPEHAYGATHYTSKDVIIASGCSGSLALVIPALANPGDNILIPTPGFSLYTTLCGHFGLECREYRLLPERSWEIDLEQMASQINARTKAILINNPSNPCGSNFSEEHLRQIVALAERYKLPIISDEVYAGMVFSGQKFIPIASVAGSVPVLTVGGLAKRYLIPGWRVGWILLHDPAGNMAKIRPAITRMSQVILGANSLVQAAIPGIFKAVQDSWHSALNQQLEKHAMHCVEKLQGVPGLGVIVPQGSLYLMVQVRTAEFTDIESDVDFSQKLLKEESVFVLPGKCFRAPNFFRVVFCAPPEVLGEACDRIAEFARRHAATKA